VTFSHLNKNGRSSTTRLHNGKHIGRVLWRKTERGSVWSDETIGILNGCDVALSGATCIIGAAQSEAVEEVCVDVQNKGAVAQTGLGAPVASVFTDIFR